MNKRIAVVVCILVFTIVMTGCSGVNKKNNTNKDSLDNTEEKIETDIEYPLFVEFAHWALEDSKKGEYIVDAKEGVEFTVNQRICELVVKVDKVSDEKITLKCHYSDDDKKIMTVKLKSGESETLDTPSMDSGGRVTFTFGKRD